jgi:RNA 3'-terminal phosphate cyclase (ATP)
MLTIDGAQKSGSGTIVRYAVAVATLLGQPLRVINARARRPQPGLRPQHLAAVRACAELCGATLSGASVGSREFTFTPGPRIRGGSFAWDIGTAGSTTMLALSVLPLACFAAQPVTACITGGVFQDFAPSPYHMQCVLAPLLRRMGVTVEIAVRRAGYVPRGAGMLEVRVTPVEPSLTAFEMLDPGRVRHAAGLAFASHLAARRVSERMAQACEERLTVAGIPAQIRRVEDTGALHPGASLAVWTETTTGALLGADRIGAPRRSAEGIGRFVAAALLADLTTGATVDRHLADQLVLFAALARGSSGYRVPQVTEHLQSNLWLAEHCGARVEVHDRQVSIEGIGLQR